MINSALLSDSLAAQVASEVIYSRLEKATIDYLTNGIIESASKELLDISLVYVEELKRNLFFEKLYKVLASHEKKFVAMLKGIWEDERKIIVANIKKMRKAYLRKDAIDQLLYPRAEFEKQLSAGATVIILTILNERGPIEMGAIPGIEIAFDVTNPEVQKWLANYTPKFSINLEEVSVAKLRTELIEGIKAGEGIPELIKRVNLTYDNWNKVRSEAIARTETIRASNRAAIEAYKQSGVVKKKVWMINPRACPWCVPLDGKTVALEKPFFNQGDKYTVKVDGKNQVMKLDYETVESPPLHPRCLLPKTRYISAGHLISGLRTRYNGKIIKLAFANGSELTITPNHMLLTPHGFASAKFLSKGDDVFYCPDFERIISSNPNNNRKPIFIDDVIETLSESSSMVSRSMPMSPEYLHGDGRFVDGNIDIIYPDSFLKGTFKSNINKHLGELNFDSCYSNLPSFFGVGNFTPKFKRLAFASDSIVGGLRQSAPFFRRRSGHSDIHGFTSPSRRNVSFEEMPSDNIATDFKPLCQNLFRNTGLIKINKIVDIQIDSFHGYVYDTQTETSLYIANGILSSNCRCAMSAWFKE